MGAWALYPPPCGVMRTAPVTPNVESSPHRRKRRLLGIAIGLSILVGLSAVGALLRSHRQTIQKTIGPDTAGSLGLTWTGAAGPGPLSTSLGSDAFYVATGDSLAAYPTSCTVPGGACKPIWQDHVIDGPLSAPVEQDGVVYTGSSSGFVYAFAARCPATSCAPLWIGQTGTRALSPPVVNSDFVFVASDRLYAFPARCGTGDELCPPAWSAELLGPASDGPPAVGGGLVVVSSRGTGGGVSAFPAVCNVRCEPIWIGRTGGPTTGVVISGGTAYAVARGQVFAFPLGCKGLCKPTWTGPFIQGGPFTPGASGRPTVGSGHLYVGALDGHLWVFPLRCSTSWCNPIGSLAFGGDPLATPIVQDGLVFVVTTGGLVTTIPDGCSPSSDSCTRPWSEVLGAGASSPPAVTSTGVFVGDDRGTLYAFGLPQP